MVLAQYPAEEVEQVRNAIEAAIHEDTGGQGLAGDVTSQSTIPKSAVGTATLLAKAPGVLAGTQVVDMVIEKVNGLIAAENTPEVMIGSQWRMREGRSVTPKEVVAEFTGSVRGILLAERLLLNCISRMSGIATHAREMADLAAPAKVLDTRKTVPGLRAMDKWAVKIGGGVGHRMGLHDRVLIKDNHIKAAGGIDKAVRAAQNFLAERPEDNKKVIATGIEVEAASEADVEQVIALIEEDAKLGSQKDLAKITRVMFDNMDCAAMTRAAKLVKSRTPSLETEASGNITVERAAEVGKTGVDFLSAGCLTHSVTGVDFSLKITS